MTIIGRCCSCGEYIYKGDGYYITRNPHMYHEGCAPQGRCHK